jgi:polyisoprenoid-binding protein YceI
LDEHALLPIPSNGGVVSGRVQDPHGQPLSNAEVSVVNAAGRAVVRGQTDAFGAFVATLTPGSYRVTANASGYRGVSCPAAIQAGGHATLGTLALPPGEALEPPVPGLWRIDPVHSSVRFVARHLALSRIHGAFTRFGGTIEIGHRAEDCLVEVSIDAASIYTGNPDRDTHLRSSDFLDVDRYPEIHFVSTRFAHQRGDRWRIDGLLSLHGITDGVRLDANYQGTRSWNGLRAGITATTELHRAHFTLDWQQMLSRGITVIGSTIDIVVDIQAVHD